MLSVGNEGDERRTSGLGLGFRARRRMEENELEEGEAVSSLEYDAVVDPDVSLSYIDEKIQEVLGHFQKVFEGEISAESSGAKLGEYGSFLPVYLRLPSVWPQQSRVPGRPNTSTSSSQNPPPENGAASNGPPVAPGSNPAPAAQQLDDTKRSDEEFTTQTGVANKISNKGNGNNLLKVRIKVGSGNVLLRPLAAIYSDMGLDYSPSSSPEESPGTSGGISLSDSPVDSPMTVYQVMTCFPVPEGYLLSPLPESFLHLVESEKMYSKSKKSGTLGMSKSDRSAEKGKFSVRKRGKNVRDNLKSKSDAEIQVGSSVRSNSSVSCVKSSRMDHPEKAFREEKTCLPDHSDDELPEVFASSDARKSSDVGVDFTKLKGEKLEEEKLNKGKASQRGPHVKGSSNSSSEILNRENDKIVHPLAPERPIPSQDTAFHEEREMNLQEAEAKNQRKSIEALVSVENKKKPPFKGDHTVKKQNAVRSLKELSKNLSKDPHRNSPRELKPVKMGHRSDSTESPFGEKMKANEVSSGFSEKANDYQNTKKGEYSTPSDASKKENFPLMANNSSSLDAVIAPIPHVVIEDNWVCCDKCQQWRLLPYGMDPAQLPKKWLCTMLYWLPGMNKCSISEDETTRALHATYQAPFAENQITLNDHPTSQAVSGAMLVNGQHVDRDQSQAGFQLAADYRKKNSSTKEFPSCGAHATVESIALRDNQTSAKGSSKYHFEQTGKSMEESFEKVKEKRKKHKTVERCSIEGGAIKQNGQIFMSKSKRGSDQDSPRISKKVKSGEARYADEAWNSVHGKSTSMTSVGVVSKSLNFSSPKDAKIALYDSEGSMKKFKVSEKVSSNKDSKENFGKKRKETEEMRRSEPRKEKKAKISKMDAMGAFKNNMDDEILQGDRGMKCSHMMMEKTKRPITEVEQKDQFNGSVESENHMNYLVSKRAHSDVHPCTVANSSSSKVSSSSKNRSNFHEMGGSPVESVSSSPLRIPNAKGSDATVNAGSSLSESEKRRSKGQSLNPNSVKTSPFAQNGSSKDYQDSALDSAHIKSKDKKPSQLSYGKEKDEYDDSKTATDDDIQYKNNTLNQEKASTGSQSRAKEKHKSSYSGVDKYRDKISDSVDLSRRKNNSRHDSDSDLRDGNYRSSEKKDAQGPRDLKLKKLQVQDSLVPNERDPHSSKSNKVSQPEYSSKSPNGDKKPSKSDFSSSTNKNSGDSTVALFEDKGKLPEQPKNLSTQNGRHQNCSAAGVLKEARDLKHTANRLKAEGLEQQSTALYFEAALKFLHVAFLLELSSTESGKHGESTQSMSMYSDTAKLCEFCAHEYERWREMAAAALAYKCMEVAYMKVVYSKHSNASKDRHELQTALQMVPSGESPSSSASDIDNLNNQSTINKSATSKVVNPPQMVGSHVIAARNRPTYVRLLDFAHDVNFAMEASRKSQNAFISASACQEESNYAPEGLASVKRVLDLSFHDVEGLLRLVRQSMDSISRWLQHS